MNPVRIKINKLGMIRESGEITLNRFMIFSGESGLGKSYLSIICHYIFAVLLDNKRISGYFDSKGFNLDKLRPALKDGAVFLKISKKDFENWLSKDAITWLGYMIKNSKIEGDISFHLPDNIPENIEFEVTEESGELGDKIEKYVNLKIFGLSYKIKDSNSMDEESPFAFLFRFFLIQKIFNSINGLSTSYVFPPSRGMMMTENVEPLTGMYAEFKKDLLNMMKAKPNRIEVPQKLKTLIKNVLDGHVDRREGQFVYLTNGIEMPLSAAAASIRELASMEFLVNNTDISKSALVIDEPEAHLHPLKQRMMADILACLAEEGCFVQVTTHSDYFIRRINELVLKYKLFKKYDGEERDKYYHACEEINENPEIRLNPNWVSAYLLQRTSDTTSVIVKQTMDNGVPFATFRNALNSSLKNSYYLEEALTNADN